MTYALRSFEYWVYSYRRVWRGSVVTSIVGPVLYLTALGVGLGKLVNRGAGVGVPYLDYVAPGILAATAMQLATFESAYPVMAAIRWTRQYFAMLATPLRTRDVLLGHQLYVAARLAVVAVNLSRCSRRVRCAPLAVRDPRVARGDLARARALCTRVRVLGLARAG